MDIRKTRTCEKCKSVVLIEKIRLYPNVDGTNLVVCEKCCEDLKLKTKEADKALSSKIESLPNPEYGTFFCTRCNYTFRIDKTKAGLTHNIQCPYCGKTDRLKAQK
jgi:DNA-directed RNA polymerase subunit RPC12/RpoP